MFLLRHLVMIMLQACHCAIFVTKVWNVRLGCSAQHQRVFYYRYCRIWLDAAYISSTSLVA